ncbi:hypothetical protein INR49_013063 [Caranx melampygus]|nr:hypothetical protein INR49_013063 [Caranx melampygus]
MVVVVLSESSRTLQSGTAALGLAPRVTMLPMPIQNATARPAPRPVTAPLELAHGKNMPRENRPRMGPPTMPKIFKAPWSSNELLCRALASTGQSVVKADAHRGSKQDGKYHIVHDSKVLLVGRVHCDCLLAAAGEGAVGGVAI